jgi:hypothetical protein
MAKFILIGAFVVVVGAMLMLMSVLKKARRRSLAEVEISSHD